MTHRLMTITVLVGAIFSATAPAQEKPIVGLIPKAQKPIAFDGKLTIGVGDQRGPPDLAWATNTFLRIVAMLFTLALLLRQGVQK